MRRFNKLMLKCPYGSVMQRISDNRNDRIAVAPKGWKFYSTYHSTGLYRMSILWAAMLPSPKFHIRREP